MHTSTRTIMRLLLFGSVCLAVWLGLPAILSEQTTEPQKAASLPSQAKEPGIPQAVGTSDPELPLGSPSAVPSTSTPTVVSLQPAVLITQVVVNQTTLDTAWLSAAQSTANSTEPVTDWAWAPTGDKLVYLTVAGELYWSNLDGSNATLIHTYSPGFNLLDEQRPLTNTLFIAHRGATPSQDHMDMLRFTPGQPPTLQEVNQPGVLFDLNWWSTDRVSGTREGTYTGGEKLVTLDSNGQVVEQRDIPFMFDGVVSPGGGLLAYVSSVGVVETPQPGFDPQTAYILNLSTNIRLQITRSEKVYHVHNWSPDGTWVLLDVFISGMCGAALVSSDGTNILAIPESCGYHLYDAVWSLDSKRIAFSIQSGGCDGESGSDCPPLQSQVYIVDVQARKVITTSVLDAGPNSSGQMMKPKWSPDGSVLGFLSFDPQCAASACSEMTPAFYFLPGSRTR